MAQINYDKIKLIVENNLRNAGFQGKFEAGWKDVVTVDNKDYPQQFNLQGLRDVISQSIVDAFTDPSVAGTASTGNTQGVPVVVQDENIINITTGIPSLSKNAVRVGDDTQVNILSDPDFLIWIASVTLALNSFASGAVPTLPTSITGKVSSGSSSVKIGG